MGGKSNASEAERKTRTLWQSGHQVLLSTATILIIEISIVKPKDL